MSGPTLDPDATVASGASLAPNDALAEAIDGAGGFDPVEEQGALARVEQSLFSRARQPLRISRYLLLRPLGSGGTGVVYDGWDPELSRRVAVKVLRVGRKDREAVARARARFLREAKSIAQLSHPNVIAVYDVGTYDAAELAPDTRRGLSEGLVEHDGVFIVMELVDGHDLASWLERERRAWPEIVEAFLRAGEGLAEAHRAGIVHRDFKPGNVLVGEDGRVKVVDFGLALTYGGSLTESPSPGSTPTTEEGLGRQPVALDKLTRTGTLLGTPAYMAPEQHRGEPADQKADQFAFCASLYRALYGQHAFEGRDMMSLFQHKSRGEIRPPPDGARVPAWVQRVVMRGLASEPSGRFSSMAELLRALRADPKKRLLRALRWSALPLGLIALAYAGWLVNRPGRVLVSATSGGEPVAGAKVYVDERELSGGEGEVSAGLHRVLVTAPDHEPAETVVEVRRGGVHEVAVDLDHEQGVFELELEPAGGHVFIDGVDYGSRLAALRIDTGPHELLLRHEGYVDQRLHWTAQAGRTERGFVALREALAWSRPATGSYRQAWWLGDADGDGLHDLLQRRFTVLTAYDPWDDEELWRIQLGPSPFVRLCDLDGDGALDPITLRDDEDAVQLRAYDGASGDPRPEPRWSRSTDWHDAALPRGAGEVACLPTEGGADLVVVGLEPGAVVRLAGADGATRWSTTLDDALLHAVILSAGTRAPSVAVVGQGGVVAVGADEGHPRWHHAMTVVPRHGEAEGEEDDGPWQRAVVRSRDGDGRWVVPATLDDDEHEDLLLHAPGHVVALGGSDGALRWRAEVDEPRDLQAGTTLGDADGDGAVDVLVTPREGVVQLVSGRSGRPLWSHDEAPGRAQLLAALPQPLVSRTGDGALVLFDAVTGREVARTALEPGASSLVAVGDWDGDAALDLLVGTGDGVLRAFDTRLQPLGTVPLEVPVEHIQTSVDGDRDGFGDLLLQARGPAVIVGPKVRWDRRPLDAIRATPVVDDFDGDGQPEVALFGSLGEGNRLQLLDAATGSVEVSSAPGETPIVIRPPAVLRQPTGADLLAVGSGLVRFDGRDGRRTGQFVTKTAYASPTVADLDGDGHDEVVLVTWEDPGTVYALDAQTLAPRWERELGPLGSFGAPHVGDVDGDDEVEVVIASLDGRVICLDREGRPQWDAQTGGRLNFEPTVADLDGDGSPEILVAPHLPEHPLVVLRGRDGVEQARWPGMATRRARPLAHDVDDDGRPEVLASTGTQGMVSLEGDGSLRWRYAFVDRDGLQPGGSGSPLLADLEGDGRLELIAGFEDGSVHVVDARDGTLVWRYRSGREEIEASPAVADVDGDGQLEVFVAGHDRQLLCLDHRPGPRRPR